MPRIHLVASVDKVTIHRDAVTIEAVSESAADDLVILKIVLPQGVAGEVRPGCLINITLDPGALRPGDTKCPGDTSYRDLMTATEIMQQAKAGN